MDSSTVSAVHCQRLTSWSLALVLGAVTPRLRTADIVIVSEPSRLRTARRGADVPRSFQESARELRAMREKMRDRQ
jgi:hypothetical protein